MTLELHRTTTDDPVFGELTRRLDDEMLSRYGELQAQFTPHNIFSSKTALIARLGAAAVGCGSFKHFDATTVELKRMFVDAGHRGARIGRALVLELETWASELGYRAVVLETGDRQPDAGRLYRSCGYVEIPRYGPYADIANSICLRKQLC